VRARHASFGISGQPRPFDDGHGIRAGPRAGNDEPHHEECERHQRVEKWRQGHHSVAEIQDGSINIKNRYFDVPGKMMDRRATGPVLKSIGPLAEGTSATPVFPTPRVEH